MRVRRFGTCAILGALLVAGCVRSDDNAVVMSSLETQLAGQYHACVPLGWNPVPAAGTYYPGANVVSQEEGTWLPAMWIAQINSRVLERRDVHAIADVLDELSQSNMLARERQGGRVTYRLTGRAIPYFFSDSRYRNNRIRIPYLCYATMVPERIVWKENAHLERLHNGKGDALTFRAEYTWHAGPIATWAQDAIIRSHSVILSPTRSPAIATFVKNGADWQIARLGTPEAGLGRVVDPTVWPSRKDGAKPSGVHRATAP